MNVSVRELKDRLSEYLKRVQAGEEIVITSRGRPVGRLMPPGAPPRQAPSALEQLRMLPSIRQGNGRRLGMADQPANVPPGTNEAIMRWLRGE